MWVPINSGNHSDVQFLCEEYFQIWAKNAKRTNTAIFRHVQSPPPPQKFMWVSFLRSFPGSEAHELFVWGATNGCLKVGA